jgi:aquaporin Z
MITHPRAPEAPRGAGAARQAAPPTRSGFRVEYLMEAALLGIFMISACGFVVLLEYPASPARLAIPDGNLRRLLTGLAMGSTAVLLIYSPWGMQSGAHFNPATTLTFLRLGKVRARDGLWYVGAQFAGAAAGVGLAWALLGRRLADRATNFAATLPGPAGWPAAFLAEATISFLLMWVILGVSNHRRYARFTGLCAGILVAAFITLEAPLSGMSMNPARSLGSALFARQWMALWIYFIAPPLGMLAAAELYVRRRGDAAVFCAKLHHQNGKRCIFCEARRAEAPSETFSSPPAL